MKITIFILLLFVLTGCYKHSAKCYDVRGTAKSVDIQYLSNSGTTTLLNVPLPLSIPVDEENEHLSINVKNNTQNGIITARIYINNKVAKQKSSNKEFGYITLIYNNW